MTNEEQQVVNSTNIWHVLGRNGEDLGIGTCGSTSDNAWKASANDSGYVLLIPCQHFGSES